MPSGFVIRSAEARDLDDLFRLARHLDSYNLPADRRRLRRLLADSAASFAGRRKEPSRRRHLFVLEDLSRGRVAGCSMVVAKHGTPGLPHLYMASYEERRTSRTLRKSVVHRCLKLGATEDGPTEVGGLVLLPAYRGRPERLGHWLSYVRFLYIAAHPGRFQKRLLAEFLPAFASKGRSPFWEYFGRKFTGFSYRDADRLSIDNKEFILSLFPRGAIYQDFFPRHVVNFLGHVGDPTLPAARILSKIGFRYLNQIEPFDGGPYYGALTRSVSLVRQARRLRLHPGAGRGAKRLFLREFDGKIRALVAPAEVRGETARLASEAAARLGAAAGDRVWSAPFL